MKKCLIAGCLALSLGACGSSKVHSSAQQITSNPQTKADAAMVQARAQKCAQKANFLNRSGRRAFLSCVGLTKAQIPTAEKCAQTQAQHDGLLSRAARRKLVNDVIKACVPA